MVPPTRRRGVRLVPVVLAGCLLAAACGSDDAADDDAASIIATTTIWADVVERVSCGSVEVEPLIPAGGDPHSFEPSLADRSRLDSAGLVVANGLGLEERLDDTLDAVEDAGTPVFRVGDHVDPLELADAEDEHEEDDGHDDHGAVDPHVWFDPVRVAGAVGALADAVSAQLGLDPAAVGACAADFAADLERLDAEIAELLAPVPSEQRRLVTSHDALGYFAERYRLEVIGAVIPSSSTLAETNPAALDALADLIEATGVRTIFGDRQGSSDASEALASRVGDVEVVELLTGTLGPSGSGADTYLGFLRSTADLIASGIR